MDKEENLLFKISTPEDLRKLDPSDLIQVSSELRQFIIDEVCNNPGHFGASLGVVELTVALHYVFNTPYDKIIWDVGHQAYGHKILTGRRECFQQTENIKGSADSQKWLRVNMMPLEPDIHPPQFQLRLGWHMLPGEKEKTDMLLLLSATEL